MNALKSLFSLRTGIIAAVVGTAVIAYTSQENKEPAITRPEDLEEEPETTTNSLSAPKTSLRPVLRPQR